MVLERTVVRALFDGLISNFHLADAAPHDGGCKPQAIAQIGLGDWYNDAHGSVNTPQLVNRSQSQKHLTESSIGARMHGTK